MTGGEGKAFKGVEQGTDPEPRLRQIVTSRARARDIGQPK